MLLLLKDFESNRKHKKSNLLNQNNYMKVSKNLRNYKMILYVPSNMTTKIPLKKNQSLPNFILHKVFVLHS